MLNNNIHLELTIGPSDVPALLQFGLMLTLFDLVLAVLVSVYQKRLSSALGYRGLVQKFAFYVVFLFLYMLVRWRLHETEWVLLAFFNGVLACIILFELASIKRHLRKLGVPESFLSFIPTDHRSKSSEREETRRDE